MLPGPGKTQMVWKSEGDHVLKAHNTIGMKQNEAQMKTLTMKMAPKGVRFPFKDLLQRHLRRAKPNPFPQCTVPDCQQCIDSVWGPSHPTPSEVPLLTQRSAYLMEVQESERKWYEAYLPMFKVEVLDWKAFKCDAPKPPEPQVKYVSLVKYFPSMADTIKREEARLQKEEDEKKAAAQLNSASANASGSDAAIDALCSASVPGSSVPGTSAFAIGAALSDGLTTLMADWAWTDTSSAPSKSADGSAAPAKRPLQVLGVSSADPTRGSGSDSSLPVPDIGGSQDENTLDLTDETEDTTHNSSAAPATAPATSASTSASASGSEDDEAEEDEEDLTDPLAAKTLAEFRIRKWKDMTNLVGSGRFPGRAGSRPHPNFPNFNLIDWSNWVYEFCESKEHLKEVCTSRTKRKALYAVLSDKLKEEAIWKARHKRSASGSKAPRRRTRALGPVLSAADAPDGLEPHIMRKSVRGKGSYFRYHAVSGEKVYYSFGSGVRADTVDVRTTAGWKNKRVTDAMDTFWKNEVIKDEMTMPYKDVDEYEFARCQSFLDAEEAQLILVCERTEEALLARHHAVRSYGRGSFGVYAVALARLTGYRRPVSVLISKLRSGSTSKNPTGVQQWFAEREAALSNVFASSGAEAAKAAKEASVAVSTPSASSSSMAGNVADYELRMSGVDSRALGSSFTASVMKADKLYTPGIARRVLAVYQTGDLNKGFFDDFYNGCAEAGLSLREFANGLKDVYNRRKSESDEDWPMTSSVPISPEQPDPAAMVSEARSPSVSLDLGKNKTGLTLDELFKLQSKAIAKDKKKKKKRSLSALDALLDGADDSNEMETDEPTTKRRKTVTGRKKSPSASASAALDKGNSDDESSSSENEVIIKKGGAKPKKKSSRK